MEHFEKSTRIGVSAKELYDWHARPGALRRLTPPWETVEIVREDPGFEVGKRVELKVGTPLGQRRWVAEHVECRPGEGFVDTQREGPFSSWRHSHEFARLGDSLCELRDRIDYKLPGGRIVAALANGTVKEKLARGFAYRHAIAKMDLEFQSRLPSAESRRFLISGGAGFLGSALSDFLRAQGHEVAVLTRSKRNPSDVRWDPAKGEIELPRLEGFDVVVHLAGESLTSGRWTEARKRLLWSSRVEGTGFLVDALRRLERPPSVFVSGSGVGFYGSDGGEVFDEESRRGSGFLAELCEAWEAAGYRAESFAERVVLLRTGVALDPRGGALKQMLPIFKLGGGGRLGDGEQWFPWIALEDWIRATTWAALAPHARGPFNLAAPGVVRQCDFAKTLGGVLGRPSVAPAPAPVLRLALGEMADEALLSSLRVNARRLREEEGFEFAFPELEQALRFSLGR